MKDVIADLDAWPGKRVALATVVDVKRSAPRPPGAKMAINDAGEVSGAVSGGCVEGAVVEAAQEMLAGAPPRLVRYGIEDDEAWSVGLPCGGEIAVWIQADRASGALPSSPARTAAGALVTDLGNGERWLVTADGPAPGRPRAPRRSRSAEELMWLERSELATLGRARILHRRHPSGAATVRRRRRGLRPPAVPRGPGDRAGGRSSIDPRGFFARPDRFPEAEQVVAAWPQEGFAPPGHRSRHGDRRAHPRPQARRRRAARRPGLRGELHRRDGIAPRAGEAPRAAARARDQRRGDGPDLGSDRARSRRAERRGDRAVDHGRDRRHAPRPQRRATA